MAISEHCLGNSQINSIPEWRVFLLNKHKRLRIQQARADISQSQREIKGIFNPEKITFSINSEHKNVACFISWHRFEKSARESRNSQHLITQRDNIRHVHGSVRIHDVRMAHFVLKIKKIFFQYWRCPRIPRLTVSVPDYGAW